MRERVKVPKVEDTKRCGKCIRGSTRWCECLVPPRLHSFQPKGVLREVGRDDRRGKSDRIDEQRGEQREQRGKDRSFTFGSLMMTSSAG